MEVVYNTVSTSNYLRPGPAKGDNSGGGEPATETQQPPPGQQRQGRRVSQGWSSETTQKESEPKQQRLIDMHEKSAN